MNKLNKFELYENLALNLRNNSFIVEMYKEINFGLQFNVNQKGNKYLLRIYEGKKGTRLDLSQIKDPIAAKLIDDLINKNETQSSSLVVREEEINDKSVNNEFEIAALTELIGIDESGKGDYLGPLVIAGVYVDKLIAGKLYEIGVTDSKKISDSKIEIIAHKIKKLCKHSIVPIGNKKYNELYEKIGNLNKLLAWGHARCIENILGMVDAKFALSDQFGDESFINISFAHKLIE